MGNLDDMTVQRLEEAVESGPEDLYALLNLAAHYRRRGQIEASSALYLRVHRVYLRQGRPEHAQACLRQLLRFDPDNRKAQLLLDDTP